MRDYFLQELEKLPWFSNVGTPLPSTANVRQISSWDQWRGPEDEAVMEIHQRQQALYDSIFSDPQLNRGEVEDLWKRIQDVVIQLASVTIPYDATQDSWHAPTAAVWHAAWTAALIGVCLSLKRDPPDDLAEQWQWFKQGHWPCALETELGRERLVVY